MQVVYRWWTGLVALAVVLQVAFAGYGAFYVAEKTDGDGVVNEDTFMDGFGLHAGFGYLVVLLMLILLVIAALARVGKKTLGRVAILFGLGILQVLLAWFGFEVPAIGAFHPLNALLIVGLSGMLAHAAWRGDRTTTA